MKLANLPDFEVRPTRVMDTLDIQHLAKAAYEELQSKFGERTQIEVLIALSMVCLHLQHGRDASARDDWALAMRDAIYESRSV
jgi:hypothetical protein